MNGAVTNPIHWEWIQPRVTCCLTCRSSAHLVAVVNGLDPEHNPRYQPSPNQTIPGKIDTWCQRFVEELCQAMAVFWPRLILRGATWDECDANECIAWLRKDGASFGWRRCDVGAARIRANAGFLVVATCPGHVGVLVPTTDGEEQLAAQAGKVCFNRGPLRRGFGGNPVEFWTHD